MEQLKNIVADMQEAWEDLANGLTEEQLHDYEEETSRLHNGIKRLGELVGQKDSDA